MRNLRRFRNRLKPIAWAATLSLVLPAALAAPVTWVGANGSFWDLTTNWAPGLPGVADDALLGAFDTVFRTGTVTVNSFAGTGRLTVSGGTLRANAASSIGALTLSGGTLGGAGPVIVSGPSVWTSGAFADAGSTTFNGPVEISGGSFRNLSGRSLTFNGTTTWTNANSLNRGLIQTGFGASFNNNGSWLDQNAFDVGVNALLGGTLSSFNNAGTYAKSGDSTTSMGIAFNNAPAGVVTIAAGTLSLNNGGTSSGTFNVASGATLAFGGGTHTLSNLTLGTGSGQLRVTGGTMNATGANAFSGTLAVAGGTLNVTDVFSASGFSLSGGTAGGSGSVLIDGPSSWTGGAFADTGSTTFNGPVEISGGTFRNLSGRNLTFNGTTTWTNVNSLNRGLIQTGFGASFNNNGAWLDQNAFDVAVNALLGGTLSSFNNAGTYAKSGDSITSLGIAFNNVPAGVVTVAAGTLSLNNGGASSGTFNVASGATLAFGGGTHTLSNLNLGAGSGQLRVSAGTVNASGTSAFAGTLAVGGGTLNVTDQFSAGGFALSGGTAGGSGSVLVSGPATWTGGAFADTGSTTFNGPVEISGGTFRNISGRSLTFNGTTTWSNVNSLNRGLIQTGFGASFNNNGAWLDQNAFDVAVNALLGGTLSSFNNAGSYAKSGDSITSIGIAFNNTPAGVVTVDAGTLSLNSGGASSGTFNVAEAATLAFGGGTHTLSNLSLGTGSGQLRVNAGAVNTSGTSAFSGTLAVAGGALSVTDLFSTSGFALSGGSAGGAGSVVVSGSSSWTGGAFADAGSTTFNGPVDISGGTFRNLSGRSLTFNGTTTWSNVNSLNRGLVQTGFGARINNNGAWLDQNAFDILVNALLGGTLSSFNNAGTYAKSGDSITSMGIAFNNAPAGVITVDVGTLSLNNGGTSSGTFNVSSGATLAFGGGTHTLSNLNLGTGSGQLRVNAGAVNTSGTSAFSGTLAVAGGVLSVADLFSTSGFALSGGSAGGAGSVVVSGSSSWTGGAFADSGSTTFSGPVDISGGTFRNLSARSLTFNGTTTWTNVNSLNRGLVQTGFGARINNNGAWLDQNAFDIVVNAALGGAQSTFNNTGSYLKTGSSVTDLSAIRYLNPGVTDVQGGVLRLPPNFVNEGLLTGDATVQATTLTNAGHLAPGVGPRTLSLTGAFVQTSAGHFDVELESPGLNDLFVVSGGATLGGTLELICFGNCTAAVGQSFTILDAADGDLDGTFSNVVLRGFGTGAFDVVYDTVHGDVLLNVTQALSPAPEPGPLAMWSVGGLVGLWLCRRRNPPTALRPTAPGG